MDIQSLLKNNPDLEKSLLKELDVLASSIRNKTLTNVNTLNFNGIIEFVRPMILIQDDKFILPKNPDIADKLKDHLAKIETATKASGRVEMLSDNTKSYVGTAWVVDHDNGIVVTNRHVIKAFAIINTTSALLKDGVRVSINFKGEHLRTEEAIFLVKKILYVSPDDHKDVAFLKIETTNLKGGKLPIKIKLAEGGGLSAKKDICLVGYPVETGYHNEKEFPDHVPMILDKMPNVKRICPGKIITAEGNVIIHDCSTLKNNSGSVLFAQDIGEAIGMNYGWGNSDAGVVENRAISASVIKAQLTEAKKYLS